MAILFFDGCGEYYTTSELFLVWSDFIGATVVATGGRRNGAYISLGNIDLLTKYYPAAQDTFYGFGFRPDSVGPDSIIVRTGKDGLFNVTLHLTPGGGIEARLNSSTVLATSATGIFTAGVWYFIELRVLVDQGTSGAVEIRVDGVQVAVNNATDTQNTADADNNFIQWFENLIFFDIDDVYIVDTSGTPAPQKTFLGDIQIDRLTPDGVGNKSEFDTAFGSANHWENVDDPTPDDDTTYNETNTLNDIDLFTFDNLAAITGGSTVLSVKAVVLGRKTDAGLAEIQIVTRPTTVDIVSSSRQLQIDFNYHEEYYDEDPQAMAAWTDSTVNASEFGVKVV